MSHSEVLDDLNDTELHQLCRRAGIAVSPKTTRERIAWLLLGEAAAVVPNPIDEWRRAICAFVLDHWFVLRSQISCPAEQLGRLLEDERGEPLSRKEVAEVLAAGDWVRKVADRSAPIACFRCIDQQVVACLVSNGANERLIQLHKKPVPTEDLTMTSTPAATLTPESAPRSAEELVKQGRFQIRRLATKLGMFNDPKTGQEDNGLLQAFLALQPEPQAQQVAIALARWDAANGGAPAAAPAPAPTPPPAAAAPAAPAPAATPAPRRSPRTSAAAAAATLPAEAVEAGGAGRVAATVDLTPVLERLDELKREIDTLKATSAQGHAAARVEAALSTATSTEVNRLLLGYLILFGENVLGGNREEILQMALEDGGAVLTGIQQKVATELRKK